MPKQRRSIVSSPTAAERDEARSVALRKLSAVGNALDTPAAYLRGALGGSPGQRMSGTELLNRYGFETPNEPVTGQGFEAIGSTVRPYVDDILGLALETAADPMNLIGIGPASKASKAAARVKALNEMSQRMRQAGAMPEEIVPLLHPSLRGPNGNPYPLHHGTSQSGLEATDLSPAHAGSQSDAGFYGSGVYFTPEHEYANNYARRGERGPRTSSGAVIKAYVDARNPLIAKNANDLRFAGLPEEILDKPPGMRTADDARRMTQVMRDMGHDSMILGGMNSADGAGHELLAFDKSQIYSPYVAPALQAVPNVDQAMLQKLAAYHAAKQGGR